MRLLVLLLVGGVTLPSPLPGRSFINHAIHAVKRGQENRVTCKSSRINPQTNCCVGHCFDLKFCRAVKLATREFQRAPPEPLRYYENEIRGRDNPTLNQPRSIE